MYFTDFSRAHAIRIMQKIASFPCAKIFLYPVDPITQGAFDYYSIVKKPIDITKIINNLLSQKYKTFVEWKKEMYQIYENSKIYNGENALVTVLALQLIKHFEKEFRKFCAYDQRLWKSEFQRISHQLSILSKQLPGQLIDQYQNLDKMSLDEIPSKPQNQKVSNDSQKVESYKVSNKKPATNSSQISQKSESAQTIKIDGNNEEENNMNYDDNFFISLEGDFDEIKMNNNNSCQTNNRLNIFGTSNPLNGDDFDSPPEIQAAKNASSSHQMAISDNTFTSQRPPVNSLESVIHKVDNTKQPLMFPQSEINCQQKFISRQAPVETDFEEFGNYTEETESKNQDPYDEDSGYIDVSGFFD
ncbi:hypothetical protein TRFO_15961 [Tritrichomonas foetus]|uniref:Bromo domain-containing protein n=1 Tax=Tritrichomonas foetus TaxID=1144522 RepID=A0A1J4KVQ4_9EUKA|nr:hypothetical protein TRFO_15961 [Tritrichomonas foetus]|eukprot:OHT13828.1 hypothetical protein TRFO_15961 [Tritrichomonas foetus]